MKNKISSKGRSTKLRCNCWGGRDRREIEAPVAAAIDGFSEEKNEIKEGKKRERDGENEASEGKQVVWFKGVFILWPVCDIDKEKGFR